MMKYSAICLLAVLCWVPVFADEPTNSETEVATAAFKCALKGEPFAFTFISRSTLTRAEEKAVRATQWAAYKTAAIALGWDKKTVAWPIAPKHLSIGTLPCDAETMPYVLMAKGKPNANGWPLFFQTHGGGSTDEKLSGPHGWEVNTRDWQAQVTVVKKLFPAGRYFIPRMANDNKGRWWYKHNLTAFDAVIKRGILFHNIDPNRIYMMGISEGAYGTEALTPFWADRFAGGCAMAGGSGAGERLYCLRNTALRNDTGEHDTAYGRAKLVQEEHAYLDKLKQADPTGYDHSLNMQKGRGHGIDYAPGPAWIATKIRDPHPNKICWFNYALDGMRRTDFAWLALSKAPTQDALIIAECDKKTNTVTVSAMMNPPKVENESPVYAKPAPKVGQRIPLAGTNLIIHLDDALLDLDKPVTVMLNGKQVFKAHAPRSARVLAETLANTGDPGRVFCGEIVIPLK